MRILDKRVYAGSPSERATVDTTEQNGGSVTLRLDGVVVPEDTAFDLAPRPGGERVLEILLVGPTEAFCVVAIRDFGGRPDGDLLLCQLSDPFPKHVYRFITTPPEALDALADLGAEAPAADGVPTEMVQPRSASMPKATAKGKAKPKGKGKGKGKGGRK